MQRAKIFLLFFMGALALSACRSESPVEFPPLTFVRYQPIYMDVASIEFIEEYKPTFSEPNVEHLMPYSPAEAMRIWVKDRIRAVGGDKALHIIIKDGSVKSTMLKKDSKMQDMLALNRDKRYDAKLAVEMRVYGSDSALSESNIMVSAARSITIPEKASANRRDFLYRQMIAELMETANAELEKNIFLHMSKNISYSQSP